MRFARWYMFINGLLTAVYGAYLTINPQFVASITGMTVSNTALTELRAMYGGLELAFGIYFLVMSFKPRHLEAALYAMLACFGGLCSARALGILLLGIDGYNGFAIVYEAASTLLSLLAIRLVRRQIRATRQV